MGIGKALKGLFVEGSPEEAAAKAGAAAPEAEAETAAPARSGRSGAALRTGKAADVDADSGDSDSAVDKDIMANLEKALDDATPKAYGYQQFRDTLAKMAKKIPNEASRFTAALAAAEGMGCNSARLIDTANDAITTLKGEQTQFNSEIAALNKADEDKQAKLKDVEDQIKSLQSQQTKLNKELAESASHIQTTQGKFQVTYKALVAEIKADIDKITEYSSTK